VLKITNLRLIIFFMFHLSLRLLYGLAALEEDAVGTDLGASSELDPCNL
jgi:hypothetical protein